MRKIVRFLTKPGILFCLVLSLGFILRFYQLGSIPRRISSDEASLGYNAYSLLLTGKDEYGTRLPLAFKSFGEYKAPLYIYFVLPAVALLELNELAIRLPAAIFGTLTIAAVYFLVKEMGATKRVGLLVAMSLAICPWHLLFTRIAYEGSIALFLLTCGVWLFIRGLGRQKFLYLGSGMGLLMLTMYAHYGVRLFVPLLVGLLFLIFRREILKQRKNIVFSVFIAVIICLPLLPGFLSAAGWQRAIYTNFASDVGFTTQINEKRAEHLWSLNKLPLPVGLLHNKLAGAVANFGENYLANFDVSFLFYKGDGDKLFATPYTGPLLLVFIPFLLAGILRLLTKFDQESGLVFSWLLLAPVPSALTKLGVSTNRAFVMIIPLCLIIGYGGEFILSKILHRKSIFVALSLTVLFTLEYTYYLDSYYVHADVRKDRDIRLVRPEVFDLIKLNQDRYKTVWITPRLGGYIHLLFYLAYPPQLFQQEASRSGYNDYGFTSVTNFDKYIFDRIPKYFDFTQNTLYVAGENELPVGVRPFAKTVYADGQDAFYLFDTAEIERCANCDLKYKPADTDIYGNLQKLP